MFRKFSRLPRPVKSIIMVMTDTALLPVALWAAISLRMDNWHLPSSGEWLMFLLAPLAALPVFLRLGLYRAVVRYIEDKAILTILAAVSIAVLVFAGLVAILQLPFIPRSSLLMYWILASIFVVSSRLFARSLLRNATLITPSSNRVLIYGAGSAGLQMAVAFRNAPEFIPVAFVDDKAALQGMVLNGLTVYPAVAIPDLLHKKHVDLVVLAIPSASKSRISEIVKQLEPLHVPIKKLPGLTEIVSGEIRVSELREVEVEDLLGRDPVPPHSDLLSANIRHLAVMVTGAGGSIGSELCRQIAASSPSVLVLYEHSEYALYTIEQDLNKAFPNLKIVPILGSVTDYQRICKTINSFDIKTIYHAAAYKHVPLVEFNPIPGIINNAFGTATCARAANHCSVNTFVLISTDKAVRPTNVMGATKRLSEMILQAMHATGSKTRFTMVRFGNVLGSSGSVVPLFKEQIRKGGPVTLTHIDINRFFMTIPEAAQLVIQAGAMGQGGDVFVLDMGEPVKIIDLARRMVHLSGLTVKDEKNPDGDIEILCTGLRPGEKLYEELLIGGDVTETSHPRIMRATETYIPMSELNPLLQELECSCEKLDSTAAFSMMKRIVNDFKAAPETVDLLQIQK